MFPKAPAASPPAPTIDDALVRRDQRDRAAARRGTTILTSESGLPNLGSTTTAQAR